MSQIISSAAICGQHFWATSKIQNLRARQTKTKTVNSDVQNQPLRPQRTQRRTLVQYSSILCALCVLRGSMSLQFQTRAITASPWKKARLDHPVHRILCAFSCVFVAVPARRYSFSHSKITSPNCSGESPRASPAQLALPARGAVRLADTAHTCFAPGGSAASCPIGMAASTVQRVSSSVAVTYHVGFHDASPQHASHVQPR